MIKTMLDPNAYDKIYFKDHIKYVSIDVGTSYHAPVSAQWLMAKDDLAVIGIEPCPSSIGEITEEFIHKTPHQRISLKENGIFKDGVCIKKLNDNFMLMECAIDNIEKASKELLYISTVDPSASTLNVSAFEYPEYTKGNTTIESSVEVTVIPLSDLLDRLTFDYIQHIKVDAENKDPEVLISAGEYLKKTAFVTIEMFARTEKLSHEVLSSFGFTILDSTANYMPAVGGINRLYGNMETIKQFDPKDIVHNYNMWRH